MPLRGNTNRILATVDSSSDTCGPVGSAVMSGTSLTMFRRSTPSPYSFQPFPGVSDALNCLTLKHSAKLMLKNPMAMFVNTARDQSCENGGTIVKSDGNGERLQFQVLLVGRETAYCKRKSTA